MGNPSLHRALSGHQTHKPKNRAMAPPILVCSEAGGQRLVFIWPFTWKVAPLKHCRWPSGPLADRGPFANGQRLATIARSETSIMHLSSVSQEMNMTAYEFFKSVQKVSWTRFMIRLSFTLMHLDVGWWACYAWRCIPLMHIGKVCLSRSFMLMNIYILFIGSTLLFCINGGFFFRGWGEGTKRNLFRFTQGNWGSCFLGMLGALQNIPE